MTTVTDYAELFRVYQYYKNYPSWKVNYTRRSAIRYFVEQLYAWALLKTGVSLPEGVIINSELARQDNFGQALSWLLGRPEGVRLSRFIGGFRIGQIISKIQKVLH